MVLQGFWKLGKVDRTAAKSDEDVDDEKGTVGAFVGDPRGFSVERPLGASERLGHGLGATERPRGNEPAAGQEKPERRKKSRAAVDRGPEETMLGGGGATGSTANTSSSTAPAASVNDFIAKTKSQKKKGEKPSRPELIAYARYLGIDPVADHDLLWIALEALEAPLPSTWSEHFDSNDRVFYYNASTRVSSWTHPLEHVYRETYATIVTFRNSNLSSVQRAEQLRNLQAECDQMEKDVHREISLWTEHHDEHGHRFYFNSQEKQSTWTDPRPAQCHLLYLKMKLVRVLSSCSGVGGVVAEKAAEKAAMEKVVDKSFEGGSSRFAPLSNSTPRREQGMRDTTSDISGKRAKVGNSGIESIDQFPRRGTNEPPGNGSARGSDHESCFIEGSTADEGFDHEGWADNEVEGERHHKTGKKKKKEKKKRHQESGDEGHHHHHHHREKSGEYENSGLRAGSNLNHSQSEPAVVSKGGREAAPPPTSTDEVRGLGGYDSYPTVPHNYQESTGLSQIGRTRVQAGIRLQPLQPISGSTLTTGGASTTSGEVPLALHMSSSVPELKPLEKLNPL
mmetsp:Transcript_98985/g.154726  ORF Transcript_98985/g.154726 Transcript_98985/m.154726 type:complete len:566 (-) Transcript_98985:122-1819(-)